MIAVRFDRPWSRRGLLVLMLVLIVALVVLVWLLLLLAKDSPPVHDASMGLRALRVINGPGTGDKPFFDGPMGAAFGKYGRIYVADTGNNRIVVFGSGGEYLFQFGALGVGKPDPKGRYSWKPGLLNYPTDVAVDEGGNVHVADFRNNQIQVFDADGHYLNAFPDRNRRIGQGSFGADGKGIAVTSLTAKGGRVYATDRYQVMVFDNDGRLIEQFGKAGPGAGDLDHPNGIAVRADSTLVVSDSNHNRVLGMSSTGSPLWSAGEPLGTTVDRTEVAIELPRGVTVADYGTILVADALACKLVRLSSLGDVIGTYGQRGSAAGEFNFPTDVASAPDGRLVVAEKGNDRVQVLAVDK